MSDCYLTGNTQVISTSSMLFKLYNGTLTFERTFSLYALVNMQMGPITRSVRTEQKTYADV